MTANLKAAEALVRDCANRLDQLFRQDYTMGEVEAELRRLLRATQSRAQQPVNEEGPPELGPQPAPGFHFDARGVLVADSESPAPSTPAQEGESTREQIDAGWVADLAYEDELKNAGYTHADRRERVRRILRAARLLRATQAQSLTDAQIVEIRDDHLPSQGEPFDCIAFARAVLRAATSHEHVYCPHCRPCKHSERVDAYDGVLRGLASYLSAGGFNSTGLVDPQEADAKIRWGIDNFVKVEAARLAMLHRVMGARGMPEVDSRKVESATTQQDVEEAARALDRLRERLSDDNMGSDAGTCWVAARLLRATQSNGRPAKAKGTESQVGSEPDESSRGCRTAESPAQSAPAQEPVAEMLNEFRFITRETNTSEDWQHGFNEMRALALSAIYAAPPPDEARELLREADSEIERLVEWLRELGKHTQSKSIDVQERIRAYLEKHK